MPRFTQLFYSPLYHQVSEDDRQQLDSLLQEIYQNSCRDYQDKAADFELCKTQLLTLLNYIYQLAPSKLYLFNKFRDKVALLSADSPDLDIDIVLKATKRSIESALIAITRHHPIIDSSKLNHLAIDVCYSGACSNIDQALSYFQASKLHFFINSAKSNYLLQLAMQFLQKYDLVRLKGDEIHMANSLYSYVTLSYALEQNHDPFMSNIDQETLDLWIDFLKISFKASSFLQFCHIFFPMPPNRPINCVETIQQLTDFLALFEKPLEKEHYLRLYDEKYDECSDIILQPKPDFSLYCTCLLAEYLQEAGYVSQLMIAINNTRFLYNGDTLVKVTENHTYQRLSDDDLLAIIDEPHLPSSLWPQISINALIRLYLTENNQEQQTHYFKLLLAKPLLPNDVLIILLNQSDLNQKKELAIYAFTHPFNQLEPKQLNKLTKNLPPSYARQYLISSMSASNLDYFKSILSEYSYLLSKELLLLAAEKGHAAAIELMFELGMDLNSCDSEGNTLALIAVYHRHIDVINILHKHKACLRTSNHCGSTPASLAVTIGDVEMIKVLHQSKAIRETFDKGVYFIESTLDGLTLFHKAVQYGQVDIIDTLLQLGYKMSNKYSVTLAYLAAEQGHLNILKILRKHGISLDKISSGNLTPAHAAAKNGHPAVIELLSEYGAELNGIDCNGNTPPCMAAENGHISIIVKYLELGVDVAISGQNTPAFIAARKGDVSFLNKLLHYGVRLDLPNSRGETAVHAAASNGHCEVIDMLCKCGVPLDTKDKRSGAPPLHAALNYGYITVLTKFFELNQNLMITNKKGNTPAHIAAYCFIDTMIRMLHSYHVPLNTQNRKGLTPAHYAARFGRTDIIKALFEFDVALDTKDKQGLTPIDTAKKYNQLGTVKLLQELGYSLSLSMANLGSIIYSFFPTSSSSTATSVSSNDYKRNGHC